MLFNYNGNFVLSTESFNPSYVLHKEKSFFKILQERGSNSSPVCLQLSGVVLLSDAHGG
jgi:hypothetical protein